MKNKHGHIGPYSVELFENWEYFRAVAAKDILCSMIQGGYAESRIEHQSKLAVKYVDELIKQLKEEEKNDYNNKNMEY